MQQLQIRKLPKRRKEKTLATSNNDKTNEDTTVITVQIHNKYFCPRIL
jgi:hypothetical protein